MNIVLTLHDIIGLVIVGLLAIALLIIGGYIAIIWVKETIKEKLHKKSDKQSILYLNWLTQCIQFRYFRKTRFIIHI